MKASCNGACCGGRRLLLMLLPTSPGNPSKSLMKQPCRCIIFIFGSLPDSHIALDGCSVGGAVEPTGHFGPQVREFISQSGHVWPSG